MMRTLGFLLASACSLTTSVIGFDIPYDIQEQTVPGNPAAHAAGVSVDVPMTPIPLNIDLSKQEAANGVSGVISTVTLTSLAFTSTNGECFDFIDTISISIESTKSGSALAAQVIATGANPGCVTSFPLTPTNVNLKPYLDEGSQVAISASGVPPASDVTFTGHLVAHASL